MKTNKTPEERFWSRVQRTDGCWLWTGAPSNRGYGQLSVERKTVGAHRFAYELMVGPIPQGLELDHLCGVRLCVNPAHLEPVDHRTNLLRGSGFAATNAQKTHCPHGHEYTPENTYHNPNPNGGRMCRTCKRAHDARDRARRRGEAA
jgi:hypothetical protein